MKDTTVVTGWITVTLLILAIVIILAFPFASTIGESARSNVEEIADKAAVILENIKEDDFFGKNEGYTYYTQANINALGERAVTVGYSKPLYMVGIYSDDLSEVVISRNGKSSDGVMRAEAFAYNTSLEFAAIRKGVLNIADSAFKGCSNLSAVYLPDGLRYIGFDAFSGSAITSITIPDTIETIEVGAFSNCPNLTEINFLGKTKPAGFYESDYPYITITFDK